MTVHSTRRHNPDADWKGRSMPDDMDTLGHGRLTGGSLSEATDAGDLCIPGSAEEKERFRITADPIQRGACHGDPRQQFRQGGRDRAIAHPGP